MKTIRNLTCLALAVTLGGLAGVCLLSGSPVLAVMAATAGLGFVAVGNN